MNSAWQKFQTNVPLRRFVVLLLIMCCLFEVRAMMNTILLTFIFTYLIVHWIRLVQRYLPKISSKIIVSVTYILILLGLYFVITVYLPMLINQVTSMVQSLVEFYKSENLTGLMKDFKQLASSSEVMAQVKNGMKLMMHTVTSVGSVTFSVFMSLILSFFYTIELKEMKQFSSLFVKAGILKWLFEDLTFFGRKFTNTFGVVLEAQFFIAICNTVITLICLAIMGMPQLVALGLMVFIFSLVPVAGVIISLVPLSFVAYSVGGIRYVIYIFIMVLVIHAIEAYILNPKFMSSRTELPIFYTFLVLLLAEHFWGIWGLIVGVPIFIFFLDVLEIKPTANN